MSLLIPVGDKTENWEEEDSQLSPLPNDPYPFHAPHQLRRWTMINPGQQAKHTAQPIAQPPPNLHRRVVVPRMSAPQLRILTAPTVIPPRAPGPSNSETTTPQSDSPETPASLSSPIAGVVDLTKSVTTISPYAVAQGGLSDIYKGEWFRVGESGEETVSVAIKLLRILTKKDQDGARARKRLNREVYVWHRLEHPNVVKLFGTSYHMSGRPAMIMQWYKNGCAAEYLMKKNPAADRLQLIIDVARGLEYLHTHRPPIVHADLKGNNVLITDEGRAALCDFGLSQVIEDLGRPTGFTLSNPDVGPLRWQAPEFLEDDEPPTPTSDVWSFACTAFELLTSQMPYAHRVRDAQVIRDMQKEIKPSGPTGLGSASLFAVDHKVSALLDRCWSFNPYDRPSMTQVRAELEQIHTLR